MKTAAEILSELRPRLRKLESRRQEILALRAKGSFWLAICVAAAAVVGIVAAGKFGTFGPFAGIFVGIVSGGIVYSIFFANTAKEFQASYKREIVGEIVREMAPEMNYQPEGMVSKEWYMGSGIFQTKPDRYDGEDYFAGRIGATELFFSELHTQERRTRTDSKGHTETYYVTLFQGLFVVADFHKNFKSDVYVLPDRLEKFGKLGLVLQNLGGKTERMESVEFERLFKVQAQDPIEARYILTPAMQERFVQLASDYTSELRAGFRGSLLYLALPKTTNWFEGNMKKPVDDVVEITRIVSELRACFELVEALDLNTRIWTKQ